MNRHRNQSHREEMKSKSKQVIHQSIKSLTILRIVCPTVIFLLLALFLLAIVFLSRSCFSISFTHQACVMFCLFLGFYFVNSFVLIGMTISCMGVWYVRSKKKRRKK